MKLKNIIKKVGGGIIRDVVPGGGIMLEVVNAALPKTKQLTGEVTGDDLAQAIEKLPEDKRAKLLEREFDVQIKELEESHDSLRTMLLAENAQSSRAYIARHSFHVVTAISVLIVVMWAYAIVNKDAALVTSITNGWAFVAAIVAPFIVLLQAYFGVLKKEHQNKLDAANGNPTATLLGGLANKFLK